MEALCAAILKRVPRLIWFGHFFWSQQVSSGYNKNTWHASVALQLATIALTPCMGSVYICVPCASTHRGLGGGGILTFPARTAVDRLRMHGDVQHCITDLENVLRTTVDHSNTQLRSIAQCMGDWKQMVREGGG